MIDARAAKINRVPLLRKSVEWLLGEGNFLAVTSMSDAAAAQTGNVRSSSQCISLFVCR